MFLLALLACQEPAPGPDGTPTDDTSPGDDTGSLDSEGADTQDTSTEPPSGAVSTLAGNDQMATVDGLGAEASFFEPKALALTADGDLIVVESSSSVRRVSPEGQVTTLSVAGAELSEGGGVAIDGQGRIYVSDPQQHCILRIDGGVAETFAGVCGVSGFADGASPLFDRPRGLSFDADGGLLVADCMNHRVRRVDASGNASTVAGVDGFGGSTEGPVETAPLYFPFDVAPQPGTGDLYLVGLDNCIRRIRDGQVENVAGLCQNYGNTGTTDGAPADARFDSPMNLAFAADGSLFVADSFNNRVRVLSADGGQVSTLVGDGAGYLDGDLDEALMDIPRGLAVSSEGTLYVADSVNFRVRKVTLDQD